MGEPLQCGGTMAKAFRQQLVRTAPRGMIISHSGNHQFIGARCFDQFQQATFNSIDAADHQALALPGDAGAVDRRIGVGGGFFRRSERQIFALGAAHEVQVGAARDALGLGIAIGRDRRSGEDRIGLRAWFPTV